MKALRITKPGGPEVLEIADVPNPSPGAGQILVRVRAAGLNRADLLQRRGHYPAPPGSPQDIPGMEYGGEVAALGAGVTNLRVGQRVFGLAGGGAQAEYIVVPAVLSLPVPDNLSDVESGAIPEAYITAHDALYAQGSLQPGERVLIHAVGSGVGIAAMQIAKAAGCAVIGTSRSADKLARARALGLDVRIDALKESFDVATIRATDGRGVALIIDFIGAEYLERNLNALALKGRIVFVSTLSGQHASLPIGTLMAKRARLVGTVLRNRSLDEKVAASLAFAEHVLPLLARAAIKVPIDKVFPLEQAPEAHRYMEENRNFGKIVFTI
jgi:NADPH:quinone reductase